MGVHCSITVLSNMVSAVLSLSATMSAILSTVLSPSFSVVLPHQHILALRISTALHCVD